MARTETTSRLHHDLAEAFIPGKGCPVCCLGRTSELRYLDNLSYECVNDFGVRLALRRALGFCNHHAYQFLDDVRDLLGVALIHRDVLATVTADLSRVARRSGWQSAGAFSRSLALATTPTAPCPACASTRQSERHALDALLDGLADAEFRESCRASDGLCYPHLEAALARATGVEQHRALLDCGIEMLSLAATRTRGAEELLDGTPAALRLSRELALAFGVPKHQTRGNGRLAAVVGPSAEPGPAGATAGWPTEACPICAAVARGQAEMVARFADGLAPQSSDGAAGLESLCSRHAWMLPSALPPERLMALLAGLAERRGESALAVRRAASEATGRSLAGLLWRVGGGSRFRAGLAGRLASPLGCSLCAAQRELEIEGLSAYAQSTLDRVTSGRAASSTLCLPHLRLLATVGASPAARAAVLRAQVAGWSDLVRELLEHIRKQDYRFRDEPRGSEQTSPRRSIEQLSGWRAVRD